MPTPEQPQQPTSSEEKGESPESFETEEELDEALRTLDEISALVDELEQRALGKGVPFEEAKELMDRRIIGGEEIQQSFGFTPEDIPPIPFSKEEIAMHERMGHYLLFEPTHTPEGQPLTIETLASRAGSNVIEKDNKGNPTKYRLWKDQFKDDGSLKDDAWFRSHESVMNATPDGGWKFVSPEVVEDTTSKNYLDQTDTLIQHWRDTVLSDTAFPDEEKQAYEDAFEQWEEDKPDLQKLAEEQNWTALAQQLAVHPVSALLRESIASIIYRIIVLHKAKNIKILQESYNWSNTPSSDGDLANAGDFGADGANVDRVGPVSGWRCRGAVFSRRSI